MKSFNTRIDAEGNEVGIDVAVAAVTMIGPLTLPLKGEFSGRISWTVEDTSRPCYFEVYLNNPNQAQFSIPVTRATDEAIEALRQELVAAWKAQL